MILYHVSMKSYNVGDVVCTNSWEDPTEYYQESIKSSKNWIDDYLDIVKPQNAPSRKKTIFAFDSIMNCGAFVGKNFNNFYYYKIEMKEPFACPMRLTDKLHKDDFEKNEIVAKEYWQPTNNWSFLEYLSETMVILEILSPPSCIEVASGNMAYGKDMDLSNKLFK